MYKQDYSKYFNNNNKNNPKNRKQKLTTVWKWVKSSLFLFVIISMLWGCVQSLQSDYQIGKVTDMTGEQIYSPGVSFEIMINSLGDRGFKTHWFGQDNDKLSEFAIKSITNWGEAFTQTGSPFYGFFVYPIGYILIGFLRLFSGVNSEGNLDYTKANYGVSVIFAILITSILMRTITLGFTWKTQKNSEKMQAVQMKQAEIQAKYKNSKDQFSKQKQQMELMALYKKEGISPLGGIATSFLSMPFLFAMFSIIRSTRALKVATVGQISLIEQPWSEIKQGHWVYLALILVYLPLQIISMLLPMILQMIKTKSKSLSEQQKKARKKQLIMQIVMLVAFVIIVTTIASGVAIYWIFSSSFQICQTLGFHFAKENKAKRIKKKRENLLKRSKNK